MNTVERRNMWHDRVEKCIAADMTNTEWCRLNKIALSTLYLWMARFRKEEPDLFDGPNASKWVEITKETLATNTAMISAKEAGVGRDETPESPLSQNHAIGVRIHVVEMSIPPGTRKFDIQNVFEVAASL